MGTPQQDSRAPGAKTGAGRSSPAVHGIPLRCPQWLAQPFLARVRQVSFKKKFKQVKMLSLFLLPETAATVMSHTVLSGHQPLSSRRAAGPCMFFHGSARVPPGALGSFLHSPLPGCIPLRRFLLHPREHSTASRRAGHPPGCRHRRSSADPWDSSCSAPAAEGLGVQPQGSGSC